MSHLCDECGSRLYMFEGKGLVCINYKVHDAIEAVRKRRKSIAAVEGV